MWSPAAMATWASGGSTGGEIAGCEESEKQQEEGRPKAQVQAAGGSWLAGLRGGLGNGDVFAIAPCDSFGEASSGGFAIPDLGLIGVLADAIPVIEAFGEKVHSVGAAFLSTFNEETDPFVPIVWDAISVHIKHAEICGGRWEAEIMGAREQLESLVVVFWNSIALVITAAEEVNGAGIAVIGGVLEQGDGVWRILWDSVSIEITICKTGSAVVVAAIGCHLEPSCGASEVAGDAVAV